MILNRINSIRNLLKRRIERRHVAKRIQSYIDHGRLPWSTGYLDYRNRQIDKSLKDLTADFINCGKGLDERIVELPWIFKNLSSTNNKLLDAGSSLNHPFILDNPLIKNKDLTICTYFPESYSKIEQRVSYVFADLRELPFRNEWFDEIACISTIEHIDMDNSMYGYKEENFNSENRKSYSYLQAVEELVRVLQNGGKLLVTFPFGKFEHHGFFQQFDEEMLGRIQNVLSINGSVSASFFKYSIEGWNYSTIDECKAMESYNPHTGVGKKEDGAAHSRAICCISFTKER